jgi:uncharacterized membrane protein YjjP (DUF1212 family)
MNTRQLHMEMLGHAGRLLLEYNESTGAIHSAVMATAQALDEKTCDVLIAYGGIAITLAGHDTIRMPVHELRYNTALQGRVHRILDDVRHRELDTGEALRQLMRVEAVTPRHLRWVAVALLGIAASCLAGLLGADIGTVIVTGVATGLGLAARQELGRRHCNLLVMPLTAAFIGAVLGGLAIRCGWTHTPGLALIVPALMLVPGPHLINGLLDGIDNYLSMCVARLSLAFGILLASALGIVIGIELALPGPLPVEQAAETNHLDVFSDMLLAGVVTCGFAVFYNTTWPQVGMAAIGGMAGHGLRFMAREADWTLEAATLLGGFAVGIVSAWIARANRIPLAAIAFAGAVTMMPGLQIYRALGGTLHLARLNGNADLSIIADTLGNMSQACLVVGALAVGLIMGAQLVPPRKIRKQEPATLFTNAEADENVAPAGAQR